MKQVHVKGPIIGSDEKWIYDWFGMEATCSNDIQSAISDANGDNLEVMINSPGGYVDEGSSIYTLLKDYNGHVTTKIVGMAASAASVIAMAGDTVKISPTARLMIHNASGGMRGDYNDMQHAATVLKECNEAIANAYILKTNLSQDEVLDLMNKETFMQASKAKELGFVDEIMFDNSNKLTNNLANGMLSQEVIEKIRNMKDSGTLEGLKNNEPSNSNPITDPVNNSTMNDNTNEKNKMELLKQRLVCKSKCVSSFLLCEKERMI